MAPDGEVTYHLLLDIQSPEGIPGWLLQPGVVLTGPAGEKWQVLAVKQVRKVTCYK